MNIKRKIKIALFSALLLGISACSPTVESMANEHVDILEDAAAALKSCTEYDDIEDTIETLEKLTKKFKALKCKSKANAYAIGYHAHSSITEEDEEEIGEKLKIARLKFLDGVSRVENYHSIALKKAIEDFQEEIN